MTLMMVTVDQICRGFAEYYETEVCQKASGIGQFGAYFMLPSINGIIRRKYEELRGSDLLRDIISEDGLLDLDQAHARAAEAMQHCGSLEVAGFKLTSADVDALYSAIKSA